MTERLPLTGLGLTAGTDRRVSSFRMSRATLFSSPKICQFGPFIHRECKTVTAETHRTNLGEDGGTGGSGTRSVAVGKPGPHALLVNFGLRSNSTVLARQECPLAETHRQQPFATLDAKSLYDPWLAIQVDIEIAFRFVLDPRALRGNLFGANRRLAFPQQTGKGGMR